MTSWLPSHVQKRLLRYALSQLELVDTDKLDLEQLDIAWGTRSSVELRDVGLHVDKLAKLAGIPSTLRPTQGTITSLRVTVPANIFSSGIEIEVQGVQITLELDQQSLTKTTGREADDRPQEEHLPTSTDVAAAFLAEEPDEEVNELEAAIQAQSVAGFDDSLDSGTGRDMGLPGFLGGFLKGIANRLEFTIRDVTFSVSFDIPSEQLSAHLQIEDNLEGMLAFSVKAVDVFGWRASPPQIHDDTQVDATKRNIIFRTIQADLTSRRSFFNTLSRVPTHSSPEDSQRMSSPSTSRVDQSTAEHLTDLTDSALMDQSIFHEPDIPFRQSHLASDASSSVMSSRHDNIPTKAMSSQTPPNDIDRFADASDDEEDDSVSMTTSRASLQTNSHMTQSLYQSQQLPLGMDVSGLQDSRFLQSEGSHESDLGSNTRNFPLRRTSDLSSSSGSIESGSNALAESQFFTHEQAHSMYESAMSNFDQTLDLVHQNPDITSHHDAISEEPVCETPKPRSPNLPTMEFDMDNGFERESMLSSNPQELPTTPKSSPLHVHLETRTLFNIDEVSIALPWVSDSSHLQNNPSTDHNAQEQEWDSRSEDEFVMPGGFNDSPRRKTNTKPSSATPTNASEPVTKLPEDGVSDIQLHVGTVQAQLDLSCGRLLYVLCQEILHGTHGNVPTPQDNPLVAASNSQSTPFSCSLSLKHLRMSLQERLTSLSQFNIATPPPDALVVLNLAGLETRIKKSGFFLSSLANIHRFTLGIPGEDIISFGTPMAASTSRILSERRASDISLQYVRSRKLGQEIHVATAPLLVTIRLQKIDERLECYGGLSGVLDISNSIASRSTILAPEPPRGSSVIPSDVRPVSLISNPPPAIAGSSAIAVNMSMDGIAIDIKGKVCGIVVKSKPVRVELSGTGVSVSLPEIKFRGPVFRDNSRNVPLKITIQDTQLRFLFAPEEEDLAAIISLIMPSNDRYEDDDDILIETLIRQRKAGSVIRANIGAINGELRSLDAMTKLNSLVEELSKLSNVAKYLPDDDRPGIMTLVNVSSVNLTAKLNAQVGKLHLESQNSRLVHVGIPPLLALEVNTLQVARNKEVLIGAILPLPDDLPMIMTKIIGDEMEPTIKVKLFNVGLEYRVSTLMSLIGVPGASTPDELVSSMIASTSTSRGEKIMSGLSRQSSDMSQGTNKTPKPLNISVQLRDCGAGLNPSNDTSRGLFLLSSAQINAIISETSPFKLQVNIRRASLLAIDDVSVLDTDIQTSLRTGSSKSSNSALSDLTRQGYRSIASLSSINVTARSDKANGDNTPLIVDIDGELVVLETCADSTQTLIQMIDRLKPPSPPSKDQAFYNDPIPAEDLMNSFSGAPFEQGESGHLNQLINLEQDQHAIEELSDEFEMIGSFYDAKNDTEEDDEYMAASMDYSIAESEPAPAPEPLRSTKPPFSSRTGLQFRLGGQTEPLTQIENHLEKIYGAGAIHGWNSATNRYGIIPVVRVHDCPFKLHLNLSTFLWNMFDGYDWQRTREKIADAVEEVQAKLDKRRVDRQRHPLDIDEEESEIGDFLFQSIWIAVPPNKDEKDLRRRINRQMDDLASETGTITSTASQSTTRPALNRKRSRSLKLDRGKRQKVSFEVRNLCADVLVLPPSVTETQNSIDIHVGDFEIYDHMPSSTWKKFVTYMHDAGPRPAGKPVIHIELQNVKPKLELSAVEMVIRATVLPLRLHVDQDTLDFITRFFEFKDDSRAVSTKPAEPPFIQRIEVKAVPIKLDYKPKKVDYAGLRSGRTKEFMNFVILDGADILLKRLIIFGISGFDNLHKILNDLWVADVTRNQLPTVLQGLAPLRPLVNVGTGVKNLIVVPMAEYQKDGRLVRSIRKGTLSFVRTTTSEIARLGARVAMGTTNLLQGAETLLSPNAATSPYDLDSEDERLSTSPSRRTESRAVSSYANQPLTVAAGIRSAVRNLERDLMYARDAIIAVGTDIKESETASEAAKALVRGTPAVILKPAIGTTRAIGTALLGAGNALDVQSRRRLEDKYK